MSTIPDDVRRRITEHDGYRLLRLNVDDAAADVSLVQAYDIDGLDCDWNGAWRAGDLEFLSAAASIRALRVSSPFTMSYGPVERLHGLQWLEVHGNHASDTFDLSNHTSLVVLRLTWASGLRLPDSTPRLRNLSLREYRPRGRTLAALPEAPALVSLGLTDSNVRTIDGVARFVALERLFVVNCRSLTDIGELRHCIRLRTVRFDYCVKLRDYSALAECGAVEEIDIHEGSVESITFVASLPRLRVLNLVGARVLDNDLGPARGIDWVIFDDRREYTHRLAELNPDAARGITSPARRGGGIETGGTDQILRDDDGKIVRRVRRFRNPA